MPFSKNKDVHFSFSENIRNQYTIKNLLLLKDFVTSHVETFSVAGGLYIIDKPEVGASLGDIIRNPLGIVFPVITQQMVDDPSEHITPTIQFTHKGIFKEQSLSKNKLVSAFQRISADVKLYLQTTEEVKKIDVVKETVKSIMSIVDSRIIISNLYTATLIGSTALLMNTWLDGSEGNNTIPEAIVGPIPLYSVQSMERSRSDRIVKYRAIGDVFLAHQRGTKDSLRIDGTLFGPNRHMFIVMLLTMQQRGEQKLEAIKNVPGGAQVANSLDDSIVLGGNKHVIPMYEKHETFPIITQTSILLDMYLQTIEWHESIEDGVKCIKYHLLFRKYIEPKGWDAMSTDKNDIKKFNMDYNETLSQRRRREMLYDMLWKLKRMGNELYRGAWTGGKSKEDWMKETTSYAPMLYAVRPEIFMNIIRAEMIGG